MLSADDALPLRPERVLIAGVTGSGKTTLARRVAGLWDLRHVEIDGLFHGENWTPRATFLDDVRAFANEDRWVTEWQYTSKGTDEILAPRAQIVIWLDYPYRIARRRLLLRTVRRRLLRTPLWNGNVEPALWERDGWTGENDILRWQKNTRTKWSERMPRIEATHPHLHVVHLDHPRALDAWLKRVDRGSAS